MARAFVLVLDSVGIGGAPDAANFGDAGADTVGHIAETCERGGADRARVRSGPLNAPHLVRLGLGEACALATGRVPPGLKSAAAPRALFGCAIEISFGKDTPSGHWELAGVPAQFEWGHFPRTVPCFPRKLVDDICRCAGVPGILGDMHASGTDIIAALGAEHLHSGWPIVYT